jgi:haloalkane dehalogenase
MFEGFTRKRIKTSGTEIAKPGEDRRPTLTWPREIPIDGEPADVSAIAAAYADWLGTSNVPKLFFKAEPGAILTVDRLINLVRGWPALTEKTIAGIHFVQEDSPDEIGKAIVDLDGNVGLTGPGRRQDGGLGLRNL